MSYTRNIHADYNLLSPEDLDELISNGFRKSLGRETIERINRQLENYGYYNGKQHRNEYGELVKAEELTRPPGVDYDPTRYATNYLDRKSTRLNSSHVAISYAVFCLKKKRKQER